MAPLVYLFLGLALAAPEVLHFESTWRTSSDHGWIMPATQNTRIGEDVTATCYSGLRDGQTIWECDLVGAPTTVADFDVACPSHYWNVKACVLCVAFGTDSITHDSSVALNLAVMARKSRLQWLDTPPSIIARLPKGGD